MKLILYLIVLTLSIAFPLGLEYPSFYKDPRVMGMGGAFIAVGGTSTSLFYNPAGLSRVPEEWGFEVDLLGFNYSVSQDALDFFRDLNEALQTEDLNGNGDPTDDRLIAINNVLIKYRGKALFISLESFPSVTKKVGRLGLSVGFLGSARLGAIPHQGFSTEGLLTVDYSLHYGPVGGASIDLSESIALGFSLKFLKRTRVYSTLTAREILENQDNLGEYISRNEQKTGDGKALDLGVLFRLNTSFMGFEPSVGASVSNVGGTTFGEAGFIPSTVNLGASLKKKRNTRFFNTFTLALDITDVFKSLPQDKDTGKRIRLGGEISVINHKLIDIYLRAGSYQGHLTFGGELRFALLRLTYATYAEEIGAYSGQDPVRTHILSAFITW
jgi:hypothetical protein